MSNRSKIAYVAVALSLVSLVLIGSTMLSYFGSVQALTTVTVKVGYGGMSVANGKTVAGFTVEVSNPTGAEVRVLFLSLELYVNGTYVFKNTVDYSGAPVRLLPLSSQSLRATMEIPDYKVGLLTQGTPQATLRVGLKVKTELITTGLTFDVAVKLK